MPLSEEEQRVLAEIERQFHESEPDLAHALGSKTVVRDAGGRLRLAVLGMVGGFVLLLVSFAKFPLLGVAGFLLMLSGAIAAERNLRRLGKAGLNAVSSRVRNGAFRQQLADQRRRAQDRFRAPNDDDKP